MHPETSPWQSGYDDFMSRVLPKLQEVGKQIGAAANAGDEQAAKVVQYYTMLHRRFDPMAATLVEEHMNKWLADQASDSTGAT